MSKNDEYRANAAECQRIARTTRSESEKRTWLDMAESWLRLIKPAQPCDPAARLDPAEPRATHELRPRTAH
jgi:hypothetical protein